MRVFTAGRRLTLGSALLGARRILTEGAGRSISRGKWDVVFGGDFLFSAGRYWCGRLGVNWEQRGMGMVAKIDLWLL
jgi:hypothetical protein